MISGYHRISEEDLRAVREQEGILDLEEEEDEDDEEGNGMNEENKVVAIKEKENTEQRENGTEVVQQAVHTANVNQEDQKKGLTVVDNLLQGRELLEALIDIEDHFVKAYDAGKEVSRMLEANWVHSQPNLGEPKDVPEGSFIVRAHTPMSNLFSCLWFNEVDQFTSHDELSFAFTFLKLKRMNPDKPFYLNSNSFSLQVLRN